MSVCVFHPYPLACSSPLTLGPHGRELADVIDAVTPFLAALDRGYLMELEASHELGIELALRCRSILVENGIEDMHVEIRESEVTGFASLYKPAISANPAAPVSLRLYARVHRRYAAAAGNSGFLAQNAKHECRSCNVDVDERGNLEMDNVARTGLSRSASFARMLKSAECNYWPTEMEVARIVSAVRKSRRMIRMTDLSVVVFTVERGDKE
ncbi:hypothetical protein EJ06DRAFT_379935 [Trichodelitschia bisporula]|uniref:Uncharacterized protein n=1 Tax=Trichodelitschia bisporula TaxID=703511 RepID=A0A6G1HZ72_9PEZI|nr:hypothetical protein EJ06DRAFT_379935 [Trichodelitschia bisporula]